MLFYAVGPILEGSLGEFSSTQEGAGEMTIRCWDRATVNKLNRHKKLSFAMLMRVAKLFLLFKIGNNNITCVFCLASVQLSIW